jgi:hypothetical protein
MATRSYRVLGVNNQTLIKMSGKKLRGAAVLQFNGQSNLADASCAASKKMSPEEFKRREEEAHQRRPSFEPLIMAQCGLQRLAFVT